MLVSSLRMANTLPRPHPEFRRLGVEDSDRDRLGMFQLHQDLRLLELLLRLEVAVAIICGRTQTSADDARSDIQQNLIAKPIF